MNICVVGNQDAILAQQLTERLNVPLYPVFHDYFADTESIIRVSNAQAVADKTVLLVYQFYSPNRETGGDRYTCINHQFLDVLFLIRKLVLHKPFRIILVLPYLPYSRQEKKGVDCAASPLELALGLIRDAGVNDIIVSDVHAHSAGDQLLHKISLADVWGTFLQSYLKQKALDEQSLCVVSPDRGGVARAGQIARFLRVDTAFVHKERQEKDHVTMREMVGNVSGKIAIIVDDILDTGRTAIQASQIVREHGAIGVIGCFSHAVLSAGALTRLQESCFDEIFVTNTLTFETKNLPTNVRVVSVVPYLVEQIDHLTQQFMHKGLSCRPHLIHYK